MNRGGVTLKDIARAVGKSVATVSKALHEHEDIALETRELVKETAQKMGYTPNITAQRLQKKRTDALGLILPVLSARQADPFFTELLSGVADEVANHNFDLLVSARSPGSQEKTAYRRLVGERRVDGLIVAQPRQQDWRIDFLTNQNIPFVAVGHFHPSLSTPGVWVDTARGMKQAVAHLVEEGRMKLALIPPPAELLYAECCLEAFESVGADYPNVERQRSVEIKALSQKEGYRAAQILLASNNSPDAIVACHDLVAMGAMAAAQDQGFEVGNDIAVVGFGDILLAEHAQPPLTTSHHPTYAMGQRACQMVLDVIAGRDLSPPQVVIEPWLVVRQSSSLALWL
jgi:LacI family transcriptional regulator